MSNTDSSKNTVEWDDINWRKVERYVFKLQKNIYIASRRGEIKRVRKLQKTLMRSWSNRVLAARRVTQDNRGKKTAGVDGIKSLSPKARMKLVGQIKPTGKSKPTRRVWIPKPGKDEKRPLGIPTMYDRALQGVIKSVLEPEWEAHFEPNSYGFRPGRSCHDAIKQIKNAIKSKPKFVLDADIAKCFDKINHLALLQKLGYTGKIRQQIKAWLKSGVIDQKVFTATSEGTPQGGVLSPLLANVALHGMEIMLTKYAKTLDIKNNKGHQVSWHTKVKSLTFIRYADDFLLIHYDLNVVQRCRDLISEWLKDMGLELKPSKTRIAHTLKPELSEDRKAGFDFLGHHIQQYSCGKYNSSKNPSTGRLLGFKTLITPSKKSCLEHQRKIRDVIKKHKDSHQAKLIIELNPIIRGWVNYYSNSDAQTVGELTRQDYLVFQKLRAWGRYKCDKWYKAKKKYWIKIGNKNWVFATREGNANPLRLLTHTEFGSSSTKYVKVKSDVSPFNGNLVYWSTRMGRNPDLKIYLANRRVQIIGTRLKTISIEFMKMYLIKRKDWFSKLAHKLTNEYDVLIFEDLNLDGMKRLWGRKVSDLSFAAFLEILQTVAVIEGKVVHFVDRYYPSSKTCSHCGYIHKELSLKDRFWDCPSCKIKDIPRDWNASVNLQRVGASTLGLGDVRLPLEAIAV